MVEVVEVVELVETLSSSSCSGRGTVDIFCVIVL